VRRERAFLGASATICLLSWVFFFPTPRAEHESGQPDDLGARIAQACSQCHMLPPPALLPKHQWRDKVNTMFHLANLELLGKYGRPIWDLDPPQVANYYIERAPTELTAEPWRSAGVSPKLNFERRFLSGGSMVVERPGGANVQLYDIFEDIPGPELIVCDMLSGWVSWTDPKDPEMGLQPIAHLKHPCRSELVDLDQDGKMDLLIAELGDPLPSDAELGSVALLRRLEGREFEVVRLTPNMGRVADARAADFDGDGDLDIVVAEFGWRKLGSIRYLENVSQRPSDLRFEMRQLDPRHGTIHVPIVDLNNDGKPDFIALISQEFETVVAFLNKGNGEFDVEEIYVAPHPHWGSSGIEVLDFDGDGDLDVLMTNGDTLDDMELRQHHGISWLENKGTFPFTRHEIDFYYGVHRAVAGDLDGDGDLDIVACSFLPDLPDERLEALSLSGIVWYEQVEPGKFVGRPIVEGIRCDFPTLVLGDFDGDNRLDIIVANLMGTPRADGSEPALVESFRRK
jgi:hypothetical protein